MGAAPADWRPSACSRAAERVATLASPLAACRPCTAPDERRGMPIPGGRGLLQPLNEIDWALGMGSRECPGLQDVLDALGHVQPRPRNRRIQRHDAVIHQPEHEFRGFVAGKVIQHKEDSQGWKFLGQREFDLQARLPMLPVGSELSGTQSVLRLEWRKVLDDAGEFSFEPGMEHGIRAAFNSFDMDPTVSWMQQGHQFGSPSSHVFVRDPVGLAFGLPALPRLRDRLERARFVFAVQI